MKRWYNKWLETRISKISAKINLLTYMVERWEAEGFSETTGAHELREHRKRLAFRRSTLIKKARK